MLPSVSLAIPTYNRSDSFAKRLKEFERFDDQLHSLWLSDNSASDQTQRILCTKVTSRILYTRNKYNIGGGANFIASLLMGDSDYVWLRGDDDPITKEQVQAVQDALHFSPDILILSPRSTAYKEIKSIKCFFEAFDETQSAGWLSMIVFKQSSLSSSLKWGYWGINSGWANIALILGILRDKPDPICLLVPVSISEDDFREDGRQSRKWSVIKTCVDNFPLIFEIIPSSKDYKLAWYQWRKSHSFNLCMTFLRSKLGLASKEVLTYASVSNLVSIATPRSTLIAILLLAINSMPKHLLAIVFATIFKFTSRDKMISLELHEVIGLSIKDGYQYIRAMQLRQHKAYPFL
jgi:glycosyltransferase involved in cell wall biosynthesis